MGYSLTVAIAVGLHIATMPSLERPRYTDSTRVYYHSGRSTRLSPPARARAEAQQDFSVPSCLAPRQLGAACPMVPYSGGPVGLHIATRPPLERPRYTDLIRVYHR